MKQIVTLFANRWLITLLVCIIFSFPSFGQLKGNYTIDASGSASSTNYKSFEAAVSDLVNGTRTDGGTANGSGVNGAVVFKIANGSYNEQISIGAISGASSTNTITFQSASGDSSKVKLHYASSTSSTNNYTLALNGASYLIFKQITISRTGSGTYAVAVAIDNNSDYNQFTGNLLIGQYKASTTTIAIVADQPVIYSSTSGNDYNIFKGNRIKYGYNGIAFTASASTDNQVVGNIIDSSGMCGVYMLYQTNFIMDGNTVNLGAFPSSAGHYVSYGLRLQNSSAFKIINNRFYNNNTATVIRAIVLFDNTSTSSAPGLIANNFVLVTGGTTSSTGISIAGCSYLNIYYNNVLNTANLSGSAAFHVYPPTQSAGTDNNVVNNNFVHKGGGYAADIPGNTTGIGTMNYNNLYTTGTNIGNWDGTNYTSLSAWKTASSKDANSISVDPAYVSNTDLHVTSSSINGKGTALSAVSTDIDGQARNTTTPDIGADEFTPASLDAGITILDSPSVFCSGVRNVYVKFSNYGTSTLTSLTINWSINGTGQTTYSWTGSVTTGNSSPSIKLGSFNFAANTNYAIKVWTSSPNTGSDQNAKNDTLKNTKISALSGTYTIGGTTPDFSGINAAILAMSSRGVCGPVIFNIRNGTYTEQIGIPQIGGVNSTNTVTWQSQSGDSSKVILNYTTAVNPGVNNAALQLNGADYHTFKGLTIQRTGTSNLAIVVELKSGAHNNKFINCQLIGIKYGAANADANIVTSVGDKDTGNVFRNNLFKYGNAAINLTSTSSTVHESSTIIEDNIIDSTYITGINVSYNDGIIIRRNKLTNIAYGSTSSTNYYGISLTGTDKAIRVTENQVLMPYGASAGILVSSSNGSSGNEGLIANNFVSVGTNGVAPYGISNVSSTYQNYYFNSVVIYNTNSGAAINVNSTGNVNLRNNIFSNLGGGFAIVSNASGIASGNYNNLFTTGSNVGAYGSSNTTDLAAWKTASSFDANSVSARPYFISNTSYITYNPAVQGKGTPVTAVTTDITGRTRGSKPSIGAFEWILKYEAGIKSISSPKPTICTGADDVKIALANNGAGTLTSATINWSINGITQKTYSWTGSVASGSSASVTLGNDTFPAGTHLIKIYISATNIGADSFPYNDTATLNLISEALPVATPGADRNICAGNTTRLGANSVPGYKYSWTSNPAGFASTAFNPTVAPATTTVYKLVVTAGATGCMHEDSVLVTVTNLPKATMDTVKVICAGDSLQIGPVADTSLTYGWSSAPTGFSSTQAQPFVKPITGTTYTLTITNKNNCTNTYNVVVSVNPAPQLLAGVDKAICGGDSVQIGRPVISGYFYKWRSVPAGFSSNLASPTVKPADTTRYFVLVTNTSGCSTEDEVVISVFPQPVAEAGSGARICPGSSVKIGTTPVTGYHYSWSSTPAGFASFSADPTVKPAVTTTYKVTTRNSSGCTKEDTVTVVVVPLPTANAGKPASICAGETIRLGSGGTNGITYSWTSTPTGFTSTDSVINVSPTVNTTYKVVATNADGCSAESQVTITIKTPPSANAGAAQTICSGATVKIGTPAVTGNIYSWTSVPTGFTSTDAQPLVSPTETTTYKLTVTNAQGCTAQSEVIVAIGPPTASYSVTNTSGLAATFTAENSSYIKYEWNFRDGKKDSGNTVTHTFPVAGTYRVGLTVIGEGGCTSTYDSSIVIGNVSINQPENQISGVSLFPNPFRSNTTLSYTLGKKANISVMLMDVTGKQIAQVVSEVQTAGEYTKTINASDYNLKAGIYFLNVQIDNASTTKKIIRVE